MANAVTSCDIAQLYGVIEQTIAAAFPALQTVEFDLQDRTELAVPACLLEVCEADDGQDPGSEQQALTLRFEARFILGFRSLTARREALALSFAFAAFLREQGRWPGVGGQPDVPRLIGCYPDDFDPRLDQYEVWRAEWNQTLWFGTSVWAGSGVLPAHVHLGQAPDIGLGNEDKYVELTANG